MLDGHQRVHVSAYTRTAMVGGGSAGLTTSKSARPCLCQNCHGRRRKCWIDNIKNVCPCLCQNCHGRRRKCWMDNIKECRSLPMPELLMMALHRRDWKKTSAESSVCPPDSPAGQETELEEDWFIWINKRSQKIMKMNVPGKKSARQNSCQ